MEPSRETPYEHTPSNPELTKEPRSVPVTGCRTTGEEDDQYYRRVLDESIDHTVRQAMRIIVANPSLALYAANTLLAQKKAARLRRRYGWEGIRVPAVLIVSITNRCNLSCKGCYMREQHRQSAPEMTPDQLRSVVFQAVSLGVSFIVLAGGEPLVRKDEIHRIAREFPGIIFAIFTNGLLIDDPTATAFARQKNIVPVLSFEGFERETDARRGEGVFRQLMQTCTVLTRQKIFFGCSLTVTRANHALLTDETFIGRMIEAGSKIFTFVEYVPIQPDTVDLFLTGTQRRSLIGYIDAFNRKFPAIFIGFPGDEEIFGGCLSAGRGFIHVSASGDLEPCPAAPFSDANLTKVPLKDALQSAFLEKIRSHHEKLTETEGGCALWTNRDWVSTILSGSRRE
jgi:MoaA/NifB/PqqE/SkfB family radical SAM enzyme